MHQQALLRPMPDTAVQPQSWPQPSVCLYVCVCVSAGTHRMRFIVQKLIAGRAMLTITCVGQWQVPPVN